MRAVRVRPAALLKQWIYDNYKASNKAISSKLYTGRVAKSVGYTR